MNQSGTTPATDTANTASPATHDAIARRAQQIWENLGRPGDRDVEIWLQAERELEAQPSGRAAQNAPSAETAPAEPTAPAADNAARFAARPLPPASVASAQPRKGRGSKAAPR